MSSSPPSWYTSFLMLHSPAHRGSLSFPLVVPGIQSASSMLGSGGTFPVVSPSLVHGRTSSRPPRSFADGSSSVLPRVGGAWLDSPPSSPVIPGQLRLWKFRSFCESTGRHRMNVNESTIYLNMSNLCSGRSLQSPLGSIKNISLLSDYEPCLNKTKRGIQPLCCGQYVGESVSSELDTKQHYNHCN